MSTALRIAHGAFGRVALLDMDWSLVRHAHPHCHVLLKVEGADTQFVVGDTEGSFASISACPRYGGNLGCADVHVLTETLNGLPSVVLPNKPHSQKGCGLGRGRSPHPDTSPFRRLGERKLCDEDFGKSLRHGLSTIHPGMPTFHFNNAAPKR